jgi:hypothetical protein
MASQGNLKQRRSNPKKKSKEQKKEAKSKTTVSSAAPSPPQEQTLWETFTSHPLIVVAPYILIPYVLYITFYFLALKHPELVRYATFGLLAPRPSVAQSDERQVLILGSMGSGTQEVATSLVQIMGLEVGHELTNAEENFCRDGTVSNLLAWRYYVANDPARLGPVIRVLCIDHGKGSGHAFHPSKYLNSSCPSSYRGWTQCHTNDCLTFVKTELSCGLQDSCMPNFRHVLHQVKHPLVALRDLKSKVCPGKAETVHPSFRQMAGVFFDDSLTCLEGLARYIIELNRALLQARDQGHIDAMFHYEDATLCGVVKLAGFDDDATAVYAPNVGKVASKCRGESQKLFDVVKADKNTLPEELSWDDLLQATSKSLVEDLKKLCKELGYPVDPPVEAKAEKKEPMKPAVPGEVY